MKNTQVKDVMTNLVVTAFPDESLTEASRKMTHNNVSGIPVVEAGRVVGVISEADLIRAALPPIHVEKGAGLLDVLLAILRAKPIVHHDALMVKDVMSSPAVTITPEANVWKAAEILELRGFKRLPVVDEEGYSVGIISRADLVRVMARSDAQLAEDVGEAIGVLGDDVFTELHVEVVRGVVTLTGAADRRSTHDLAIKLARNVPGLAGLRDQMTFNYDDSHFARELMGPQPSEGLTVGSVVRQGEV